MTDKPYMALRCPNCSGTGTKSGGDCDCPSCFGQGFLIIDSYTGQYIFQGFPPITDEKVKKTKGGKSV